MSIFGTIMDKIFHHPVAAAATAAPVAPTPAGSAALAAAPAAQVAAAPVDVGAVLTAMAAAKNGGGNWQTSIVDLLKLLDLDSSLSARHALADELGVHVAADGTAEENVALHRAVMAKLAANGGTVPAGLS